MEGALQIFLNGIKGKTEGIKDQIQIIVLAVPNTWCLLRWIIFIHGMQGSAIIESTIQKMIPVSLLKNLHLMFFQLPAAHE